MSPRVKARLRAEDRQCVRASAIATRLTFLKHKPEKIVILTHVKWLPLPVSFAKRKNFCSGNRTGYVVFGSEATARLYRRHFPGRFAPHWRRRGCHRR